MLNLKNTEKVREKGTIIKFEKKLSETPLELNK